jgi:GNAT superfamily N-acetyltransferase
MKKQKKKKKLKKKRIKNTRKKRGNNNHNKNNNGNRISQFINKEPKSLNPIITNDIEEDFKMMSDDISGELGDFYWNIFRFKDVLETFLIGEVGIVRLGFYQSRKDVKPHIILGSIEIREKDRGKGIGKKWINSIINITKSYDYGLVLKPSCLDYGDNCYRQNKMILERVIPIIENPIDKMRLHNHLIESISRYENTPPKQRNHLLIENSNRLWIYYSNLGFTPFNETHMVYGKEID